MAEGFQSKLDPRLEAVLSLIRADSHADIGTDHAGLPIRLVQTGRVRRCVGIELNAAPLELAQRQVARAGLDGQIDLRQGNGLEPLEPGEVQSVSICGMGAATMRGILERGMGRLPEALVLQPNDSPQPLRAWAQQQGYWLAEEFLIPGGPPLHWKYPVLNLVRRTGPDPAYAGVPQDLGLCWGPLLLRRRDPALLEQLEAQRVRLTPLADSGRPAARELTTVLEALKWLQTVDRPLIN